MEPIRDESHKPPESRTDSAKTVLKESLTMCLSHAIVVQQERDHPVPILSHRGALLYSRAMRLTVLLLALAAAGCGGSSVTPSPTPPPAVVVVPPVVSPVIQTILVGACPDAAPGLEIGFYRQIGCNAFDQPIQLVRRWTLAPKVYLKTIDEAGAPIDTVTLDTVQNAMIDVAPRWTAGRFGLEGVLRGSDTREGQTGWITVKWPVTTGIGLSCGSSAVAVDGGSIELNYKIASCACNGSAMRPRTARHELGHALGYYHTDSTNDLMSGLGVAGCDAGLSPREQQAVAYHYR